MSTHFSHSDIESVAVEIGNNYRLATITLLTGDTADSMLSDKWSFGGPGEVQYLIHPTGWSVTPNATVYKHYL